MKACNQCGKCCIAYSNGGLSATAEEISWWETFRPEIFAYVDNGNIWVNPTTGEMLDTCPWLQKVPQQNKYVCGIYHDRPDDCKHYPVEIEQMVKDECEMLEVRDLTDPAKAQQTLDRIMADSRPAAGA